MSGKWWGIKRIEEYIFDEINKEEKDKNKFKETEKEEDNKDIKKDNKIKFKD